MKFSTASGNTGIFTYTSSSISIFRSVFSRKANIDSYALFSVPCNQIWQTSTNGDVVNPYRSNAFGANILSNEYVNGKGIITFDNGKIIREGINTAIIGKPNVGKSSLLNAIVKEDRAIVTKYEGTTRDTIEEFINIKGIPLKIVDTAGIRNTDNEIEKIGIAKSKKLAQNSDLVIAIFDSNKELDNDDCVILNMLDPIKTIILLNKTDLDCKINEENQLFKRFRNIIKISALKNEGIEEIFECIEKLFNLNNINVDNEILITNERHKNCIHNSINELIKAEENLNNNMPIDIVEIYLKNVLSELGLITGEEASEEIVNEIFSRFCLGK